MQRPSAFCITLLDLGPVQGYVAAMSESDADKLARIQAVVTALLEDRVAASLADVEQAIGAWRAGQTGPLEAHGALLKHAARCERIVDRVTRASGQRPAAILRDALDAGVIEKAEFVELTGVDPDGVEPAGTLLQDEAPAPPDKRASIEQLLERGPVLIHVDARRDDVIIPARFRGDPKLVLRFGYGLTPAIVDLLVDDTGISGTLTFGGVPFHCVLPWPGIYAAVVEGEQRGMVWPEDVPDVLLVPPPRPRPASVEIRTDATPIPARGDDAGPDDDKPQRARRGSHLKLVE
jgi:stringent starvation protein B